MLTAESRREKDNHVGGLLYLRNSAVCRSKRLGNDRWYNCFLIEFSQDGCHSTQNMGEDLFEQHNFFYCQRDWLEPETTRRH